MSEGTLPSHLGGQNGKSWTDDASLNIMSQLGCTRMLDIGCGYGGQVNTATALGWDAYGVDGDWTVLPKKPNFFLHDFTTGVFQFGGEVDLIWCVEFLEHVEEQYLDNFMSVFRDSNARYAIVTHAIPGQGGHHHVNCQFKEYWFEVFAKYNFIYSGNLTDEVRKQSNMGKPFIARTGLVFKRR